MNGIKIIDIICNIINQNKNNVLDNKLDSDNLFIKKDNINNKNYSESILSEKLSDEESITDKTLTESSKIKEKPEELKTEKPKIEKTEETEGLAHLTLEEKLKNLKQKNLK
jgi:hypothetical protein